VVVGVVEVEAVVVEPAEGEPVVVGVVEVEAVEAGAVREDSEEVIGCPSL
jgi:hypothetical protein